MKILFIGDTHGIIGSVDYLDSYLAVNSSIDLIISVGDFGYWSFTKTFLDRMNDVVSKHNLRLIFVDGNHEDHVLLSTLPVIRVFGAECGLVRSAIYHAHRGEMALLDGKRFVFLGGATSIDRDVRIEGHTWFREESISYTDFLRAFDQGTTDVLVTHQAPIPYHVFFRLAVEPWNTLDVLCATESRGVGKVLSALDASVCVHGHYHARRGYTVEGRHVESLGDYRFHGDVASWAWVLDTDSLD